MERARFSVLYIISNGQHNLQPQITLHEIQLALKNYRDNAV